MNTNTNTNTNTTATVKEGDQYIGKWAPATAPNNFIRGLVIQAIENGVAEAVDQDGCLVTAVRD